MPWQQQVADIAGEVDPSGKLCYRDVVVTVPRQSGKTTVVLSVVVGRAEAPKEFGGRQKMLYAAQTGTAAREKWLEDYVPVVQAAGAMKNRFKVRYSNGGEKIMFHTSGSIFGPIPTKTDSGHGKVLDFGALDEAFAQPDNRVEAAWSPAMITRRQAQMWVLSTAGDAKAHYLREKVKSCRDIALVDRGYGTAYIEFSAPEDREDFDNPELWFQCMPALGFTQTVESIMAEFVKMDINDFRRAYLNQWVDKVTGSIFPAHKWTLLRKPGTERITRPVFAVDMNYERTHTSVVMCASSGDEGRPVIRVIRHQEGNQWVGQYLEDLRDEYDPAAIVIDSAGPAGSLITDLVTNRYLDITATTATDMVAACGMFYDAVDQLQVLHWGEPVLELAVGGAEKRPLGDAWALTRKKSADEARTNIAPLVASVLAYWAQVKFGDPADYDESDGFG